MIPERTYTGGGIEIQDGQGETSEELIPENATGTHTRRGIKMVPDECKTLQVRRKNFIPLEGRREPGDSKARPGNYPKGADCGQSQVNILDTREREVGRTAGTVTRGKGDRAAGPWGKIRRLSRRLRRNTPHSQHQKDVRRGYWGMASNPLVWRGAVFPRKLTPNKIV